MIFKNLFLFAFVFAITNAQGDSSLEKGTTVITRPILFRSEFISKGTLHALRNYSTQFGYDVFGFPVFKNSYYTKILGWNDTVLAQSPDYARLLNIHIKDYILANKNKFHPDTINSYKQGIFTKNPIAADGTPLQWHHGRDGYYLLKITDHKKLSHIGGAKTYGYKYSEALSRIPHRNITLTAYRWGKFLALEMILSTLSLTTDEEKTKNDYIINAVSSVSAGTVAWGVESLLISAFPLMGGGSPSFISGLAINLPGPACWIASGIFFLTKFAIISGWKQYQIKEALAVEKQSKIYEKRYRQIILKKKINNNSNQLKSLL